MNCVCPTMRGFAIMPGNSIGPEGVQALVPALGRLGQLTSLQLTRE